VLALVWRDYFYGTRGLLSDTNIQQNGTRLMANVFGLVKNFHFLLPFLAAGLFLAWRRQRRLLLLLVSLSFFHLPAILTATEGGVFLLPLYPILTLVIALGVRAGLDSSAWRTVTRVALVLYAGVSLLIWSQPYDRKFRDGLVDGLRAVPPGSVLVTTWSFCQTLDYYGGAPRDTLVESRRLEWLEQRNKLAEAMRGDRPVYLMEAHYPTPGTRWLLPRAIQERHYEQNALMPRLRRRYGVQGSPVFSRPGGPTVYRLSRP